MKTPASIEQALAKKDDEVRANNLKVGQFENLKMTEECGSVRM